MEKFYENQMHMLSTASPFNLGERILYMRMCVCVHACAVSSHRVCPSTWSKLIHNLQKQCVRMHGYHFPMWIIILLMSTLRTHFVTIATGDAIKFSLAFFGICFSFSPPIASEACAKMGKMPTLIEININIIWWYTIYPQVDSPGWGNRKPHTRHSIQMRTRPNQDNTKYWILSPPLDGSRLPRSGMRANVIIYRSRAFR